MKTSMRLLVYISAALIAGSMAVGCQKKLTKVPEPMQEPAPAVAAPRPARVDTTGASTFKEADLQGELLRQAREALQNVYFDFNKSGIKPEGEKQLGIISKFMMEHGSLRVLVAGNCDERGSAEYNIGLGQRRAQAAKDFLVNLGVASNQLEVTSYGKERLAVTGCTDEACHAKNRRDEFTVLEGSAPSVSQAQ